MNPRFVHLRLHTEYSLVDGIVRIKPLMATAQEQGMPVLALTDQSNLFAMVKFYRAAMAAGIKPIIGVETYIAPKNLRDKTPSGIPNESYSFVLLVKDNHFRTKSLNIINNLYVRKLASI